MARRRWRRPPRRFRRRWRRTRRTRRRLWVRRPTAGSYFTQKLTKIATVNVSFQSASTAKLFSVTWKLQDFVTNVYFDYYKFLKVKWTLTPLIPAQRIANYCMGFSIIDYDDTEVSTAASNVLPWANNSTSRQIHSGRYHSRYFTPRPTFGPQGQQNVIIPNTKNFWLNAADPTRTWLGIKWALFNPLSTEIQYFKQTKSVWIRFKCSL